MATDHPDQGFLHRARLEGKRYGDDPWVFLRELGQNSRDAAATRIDVRTGWSDGMLALAFADDGTGMTRVHARRYLFRLYSSSKEADGAAAGRFGVGFWSVLRFEPAELEVHARTGREDEAGWGVWLPGDLQDWRWLPCAHEGRGTTVILRRPGEAADLEAFRAEVRAGLARYLAHLRTSRRRSAPLPVRLDGELVTRPLALPGAESLEFVEGPVTGVVGFGPRPSYRLLARGLPVAEGAFLEELEAGVRRVRPAVEREGVAPVYLLNSDALRVVLSRQEVERDRALTQLLAVARHRFDELVSRTIDGAVRARPWRRLGSWLRTCGRSLAARPLWVKALGLSLLLVVCGGGLGLFAAWAAREPAQVAAPRPAPVAAPRPDAPWSPLLSAESAADLHAGTVTPRAGAESGWALRYSPPGPLLLRLTALEGHDPARGFVQSTAGPRFSPPAARATDADVEIELVLPPGPLGRPFLPVPAGFQPTAGGATLDGAPLSLEVSDGGLLRPARDLTGPGTLRYEVAPGGPRPPGLAGTPAWASGIRVPAALLSALEGAEGGEPRERVERLVQAVQALIVYDRSPGAVARLEEARTRHPRDWLLAVVEAGAGDCDVLNGALVALLVRGGLPARLAVGVAGRDGGGVPGLHAWTEVWLGGRLEAIDATRGARLPAGPALAERAIAAAGAVEPSGGVPAGAAPTDPRAAAELLAAALAALAGLGLALLVLTGLGRRGRVREQGGVEARRALLAGMAEDALRRPRAWRHVPGLWRRPYLPCLHGRRASLAQLAERIPAGEMFLGREGDELAEAARRAGVLVLDAEDACFGPLFRRTAGLRDLGELALDRPVEPEGEGERALLGAVHRAVAAAGAPPVRLAAAGPERLCHDVDLAPLRPAPGSGFPQRFTAVHRDHPWVRELGAGLAREAPALAAAVLLDKLAAESTLLAAAAPALRRQAARAALTEEP